MKASRRTAERRAGRTNRGQGCRTVRDDRHGWAGRHGKLMENRRGMGMEQAGRADREDRRVETGRGQAGKTFKENKRAFDGKWAGRGRQADQRSQADGTEKDRHAGQDTQRGKADGMEEGSHAG